MSYRQLSAEELMDLWNRYMNVVNASFTGDRLTKIVNMSEQLQERMMMAPAASRAHFHNAYVGGYLDHILNVNTIAHELNEVWKRHDKHVNYTEEEINLVTLFHDLGKIGEPNVAFYVDQDDNWLREKRGELFKINPEITNMNGADRSLYMLQHYGITLSVQEWIAIKIHEGLYEESNQEYLKQYEQRKFLRSTLPILLSQADLTATWVEYHRWENDNNDAPSTNNKKIKRKETLEETLSKSNLQDIFNDLFVKK